MTKRSFQQTQSLVERALTALEKPSGTDYPGYLWVRSIWDDTVVYNGFDEKTYRRSFSIDESETVTFGDREEVREVVEYERVPMPAFAVNFSAQQPDYVEWSGDVFEAGVYADKKCAFTPEDLKAVAEHNSGRLIPLKIEHQDTPLDAVLAGFGMTEVVEKDGKLAAKVRVPKWLDDGLGNTERKVSLGFGKDLKTIREISLVRNPRVVTAQLFARDLARSFSAANPEALSLTKDEIQALNALAQAKNPAPAPARTEGNAPTMTFQEKTKAAFALLTPEQRVTVGLTDAEIDNAANFAAPTPDPRDEVMARMRGENEYNALLLEGYAPPKDQFLARFTAAVKEDGGGSVTFSNGSVTTGNAVKELIDLAKAGRKVTLGGGQLPNFSEEEGKSALSEYDKALGLKESK